jgi:hypothetical protein
MNEAVIDHDFNDHGVSKPIRADQASNIKLLKVNNPAAASRRHSQIEAWLETGSHHVLTTRAKRDAVE